jgi:hypothetical protein
MRHGDLWISSTYADGTSDEDSAGSNISGCDDALSEGIRHDLTYRVIGLLEQFALPDN